MTGAPGGDGGLQASPAGAGPPADPARRGLPRAQEPLVTWPLLMSPGRALEGLRVELAARGLATAGMTITCRGRPSAGSVRSSSDRQAGRRGWLPASPVSLCDGGG